MTQWAGGQHPLLTALRHNPQRGALQPAANRRMQMEQQAAQMKFQADQQKQQNFLRALQGMTQQFQMMQQQKWRTEEAEKERAAAQKRTETQAAARGERESFKTDARRFIREGGDPAGWLAKLGKEQFGGDTTKAAWSVLGVEMPTGKAGAIKAEILGKAESIKKRIEDGATADDVAGDVAAIEEALRLNAADWTPDQVDALATGLQLYVPGVLGTLRAQYARGRQMLTGQTAAPTAATPSAAAPPLGPVGRMAEGTPLASLTPTDTLNVPLPSDKGVLRGTPLHPEHWSGFGEHVEERKRHMRDRLFDLKQWLWGPSGPSGPVASQPADPNAPSSMTGELWDMFKADAPFSASQPFMPTTQPVNPVQQMLDEILRNYSGPLSPRR